MAISHINFLSSSSLINFFSLRMTDEAAADEPNQQEECTNS